MKALLRWFRKPRRYSGLPMLGCLSCGTALPNHQTWCVALLKEGQ